MNKEAQAAWEAGYIASGSMTEALNELKSAGNWGVVDMFGGGIITTAIKYSKLDEAKKTLQRAQAQLQDFSDKLETASLTCNLDFYIDDFLTVADYFFDGFLVDWLVQGQIDDATRHLEEALEKVKDIMRELEWS